LDSVREVFIVDSSHKPVNDCKHYKRKQFGADIPIFGIRIVVTGPGIARRFVGVTGLGVSGSCADSSNGRQDMAKRVAEIKISRTQN
jgi:hypothetical protein